MVAVSRRDHLCAALNNRLARPELETILRDAEPTVLVLGSAGCAPDGIGPVARACLRHAPCPVVVVSGAMSGVPVMA